MSIPKDIGLEMYKKMLRIRLFEEEALKLFKDGRIPGRTFPCTGEEAVSAGVSMHLCDSDFITSTHRPNGNLIAKGISLKEMMAELYGKDGGSCRGKGGPMHIAEIEKGIIGANGIVGGGFPLACGSAFASQYRNDNGVTVCYFGDGATNQGTFHESLNLASIWSLPIVFVCINNKYGMSMKQEEHQKIEDIVERAPSYRMPSVIVDGNNAIAVYEAAKEAIEFARLGKGPFFMECKTYRKTGHSAEDPQSYRPKSEMDLWQEKDPIHCLAIAMLEDGVVCEADLDEAEKKIREEILEAVQYSENSPLPKPEDALRDVYCGNGGECS